MIFLDLSEAYDKVCHKRLLYKLDQLGIEGKLFDWFRSYLSGRSQKVVLSGQASDYMNSFGSLPHGSILAPLLFLIFLNDIENDIQSNISLFADDVSLLKNFQNCIDLEQTLNSVLNTLNNWALKWGMEFNPSKTEIMIFSNNKIKSKPNITFKGINLKQVPSHKHLGIHLSEDMHWTLHINNCTKKASKKLGQLRRNSFKLKTHQMIDIYKSMIRLILEYGSVLIDNCSTNDSLKLQQCQRTAALICTGAMRRTESKLLMDYLGWKSLQERRKLMKLSMFYKIVRRTAPPYLHKYATIAAPSSHSLRNRSCAHIVPIKCRLESYKKSFIPSTIETWNNLPDSIQNSNKLFTFQTQISKTCELDPAPSFLVKDFLDVILPFVARMCNTSIQEGSLPASQKRAIVTPALKKHDLDCTDVKNYRPISNLTFMSKIVEKLVLAQLSTYLVENNLFPKFQSGFRKFHSTESALLRVMSDICSAIDKGHVALLSLLDVSAAFDTVDHAILLERLSTSCGLAGPACSWIGSFITGRTQSVHLAGTRSPWADVRYGIPQGSVLGPVLYVLYTADIAKIIESLGFQVHLYADDVQLYASCVPSDSVQLSQRVLLAIETIGTWMSSNRLRLNPDKTQYIWFGTRQRLKNRDIRGLTALSSSLVETSSVRDLGVILDSELTMEEHVIKLCQTCFFHLRRIRSVRRSLTSQALNTLVHAFISSRIDFCNGVLCGISGYLIDRLQSVLNSSARLVLNIRKYDHISAALRDNLHWLPIHQRVQFKICLFVRSCLVGAAPTYLAESCRYVRSATGRQNLRSAARGDLIGPPWRLKGYGYRGFSVAGPRLWNALPSDVRNLDISLETFKKNLKTYFMRQP